LVVKKNSLLLEVLQIVEVAAVEVAHVQRLVAGNRKHNV